MATMTKPTNSIRMTDRHLRITTTKARPSLHTPNSSHSLRTASSISMADLLHSSTISASSMEVPSLDILSLNTTKAIPRRLSSGISITMLPTCHHKDITTPSKAIILQDQANILSDRQKRIVASWVPWPAEPLVRTAATR